MNLRIFRRLVACTVAFTLVSLTPLWAQLVITPSGSGGSASSRQLQHIFDVADYGAAGDTRHVIDAVATNSSTTVTSATAAFTSADIGKVVFGIETATHLQRIPRGTITAVGSATSITVSVAATANATVKLVFGTDDTTAIQNAAIAAKAAVPRGTVLLHGGGYLFTKCLFDTSNSLGGGGALQDAISIEGAGSGQTTFYVDPAFDFATTSAGNGIFNKQTTGANVQQIKMRGFTVDGSNATYSASGYYVIFAYAPKSLYEDVRVWHFTGFTSGFYAYGAESLGVRLHVEDLAYNCLTVETSFTFLESYAGNCGNFSLHVNGVDGTTYTGSSVDWIGGILDESTTAAAYLQNSKDVVFLGSTLFGPVSGYALIVDGLSVGKVIGSRVVPFTTSGNRGGASVLSGGVLYASNSTIDKSGSGVGLANAGTVYDLGGNTVPSVSGTARQTGAGGFGAAPTISSGFGGTPTVPSNNGTAAFTINVGSGGAAQTGVIGLPTAATGWRVNCDDVTTKSSTVYLTKQTATSSTTATVGLFDAAGAAAAWVASDILVCDATAY